MRITERDELMRKFDTKFWSPGCVTSHKQNVKQNIKHTLCALWFKWYRQDLWCHIDGLLLKRKFHCFILTGRETRWEVGAGLRREAREARKQRAVLVRVSLPGCHDCGDFYKHPLSTFIFIVSLCNESAKTATQMMQKSRCSGVQWNALDRSLEEISFF